MDGSAYVVVFSGCWSVGSVGTEWQFRGFVKKISRNGYCLNGCSSRADFVSKNVLVFLGEALRYPQGMLGHCRRMWCRCRLKLRSMHVGTWYLGPVSTVLRSCAWSY